MACALAATGCLAAGDRDPRQTKLEDVEARLQALETGRPAILLPRGGLEALRANAKGRLGEALAKRVLRDADLVLEEPPVERAFDAPGKRILDSSRAVLYRLTTLCVAFELSGDAKYAARAEKEMLYASAYKDWNPAHFLDTAEMCLAVSLGLDWLRDAMRAESVRTITAALVEKGLEPSLSGRKQFWVDGANNWSAVCHAGMIAGALATREKDPARASALIHRAATKLPKHLEASYGLDGAYPEGATYWEYGSEFAVLAIAMLDAAFGDDFGLSTCAPGLAKTGAYVNCVHGPSGMPFSYADCWIPLKSKDGQSLFPCGAALPWLSARFGHPEQMEGDVENAFMKVATARPPLPKTARTEAIAGILYPRTLPLALLFLRESGKASPDDGALSYFGGNAQGASISVHRSAWTKDASFLGVKGGTPSASHGHMDSGSFVFEADGVRWAEDLGMVKYSRLESRGVKLWDGAQDGQRWDVFRTGPASHNILVVDGQRQRAAAYAKTSFFRGEPGRQASAVDLSSTYEGQLKKALRCFQLLPDGRLLLCDWLEGLKPGTKVRWQLCTRAELSLAGGKAALSRYGKTLEIEVLPQGAKGVWSSVPCSSLLKDFDMEEDKDATMAYCDFEAPESGALTIPVSFTPGSVEGGGGSAKLFDAASTFKESLK